MASLTTGLIKNLQIAGVRPSSTFSLKMINTDSFNSTVQIRGLYVEGTVKKDYVLDSQTLPPAGVLSKDYYAQFDSFEFRFVTSSDAVKISAGGKDGAGNLNVQYNIMPVELDLLGSDRSSGATGFSNLNRIYVPNFSGNNVAAVNAKNNSLQGSIIVGSGPIGIAVNPLTNRIYVANYASNNVSVIDGHSNAVLTNVAVNSHPLGVGINTSLNRIYVTNQGSSNVSVIDGLTNAVIATITVGSFPGGVDANSSTNKIYVTNQGSNNVSVINASTNTVIATVEIPN